MESDAVGSVIAAPLRAACFARVEQTIQRREYPQREQRRRHDAADHHHGERALHLGADPGAERRRHEAERGDECLANPAKLVLRVSRDW
jgi:hypothetical protein